MSSVLAEFLQQLFTLIFTAVVVVVLGGKLAWVLVLFVPFIIYSAGRIGRRVRHTTRRGQDKLADIQNILHETITGNRIVKAFSMESWEIARFAQGRAAPVPRQSALGGGGGDQFAADGHLRRHRHRLAAAAGPRADRARRVHARAHFSPSSSRCSSSMIRCASLRSSTTIFSRRWARRRKSSSSWIREDEVQEKPRREAVAAIFQEASALRTCAFPTRRNGDERAKCCATSTWRSQPGEVVAVVGSSGAGKSTLVHLIPRFFDVTAGRLLIDGHDVRDVTLASLRSQIGVVTQETVLFNDTVRNNIAYGQPAISQKQVEAAARAAWRTTSLWSLPDGYDTMIGERGVRLSGGERQRIAIARALLKNAPILILDEATSALDSESEALVQSALQNLMTGRTVFVIAHRLSPSAGPTASWCSKTEPSPRSARTKSSCRKLGTYRRLYDLQFAEWSSPSECVGSHAARPRRPATAGELPDRLRRNSMPIRSMTGFAQVKGQVADPRAGPARAAGIYTVLKSVNHRFLDLHFRMPSDSDALEMKLRRLLKEKLARGHVEVTLNLERGGSESFALNRRLVGGYVQAFRAAAAEFGLAAEPDLNAVLRLPGALDAAALPADGALETSVLREGGRSSRSTSTRCAKRKGAALNASCAAHGRDLQGRRAAWRSIARQCNRPMSTS